MTEAELLARFEETQALLKGHFLLSSGLHSPRYMQCARLLAHPDIAQSLGRALAQKSGAKPDLVVSPAMGGLIIGQEVARALGVRHYFTERDNGVMTLRRGFSIQPGESIVIVEDVLTTGKSSQEVIDVLRSLGGRPIAVLAIVDRSSGRTSLPVPKESLLQLTIPSYAALECPDCKAGTPVVKPGSRTQPK
jgi:orotate phosphoribosyltransferase